MTRKIKTILFSSLLLAISIILLLVFFVFIKPQKSNLPLSILTSNISLQKGQINYNFYTLSHQDAQLEFEMSKDNIVEINKDYIKGINSGIVEITITAKYDKRQAKSSFTVYVYESGYTYSVIPRENCNYSNNKLILESSHCQFRVELYDQLGNTLDSDFTYQVTNEATLSIQFGTFLLTTYNNCQIQITYSEIDFIVSINAELLQTN